MDLPDHLVKQVKLRALQDGRKLKDAVADLLRKGLTVTMDAQHEPEEPTVTTDKKSGLPLIVSKRFPAKHEELTPDRIAEILLAQEVEWLHGAGGQ